MESHRHDDSKSSSEDKDQSEQVNDATSGSNIRSYNCVYCKQGFTNAQALGGHMNIHRKERARIRQSTVVPSVSNRHEEGYVNPRFFPPTTSNYQTCYSASPGAQMSHHQTYIPVSTSSTRYPHGYHAEEQHNRKPRTLSSPFDDDWCMNLSLQIGPSRSGDIEEDKGQDDKEDDLDLELRLGHDP